MHLGNICSVFCLYFVLRFKSANGHHVASDVLPSLSTALRTQKRDLTYQQVYFNDLLRQKVYGNSMQQCPCVIKPGTNQCITYDSRFQASSIEEAILAFPDTSGDPRALEASIGGNLNAEAFSCRTLECQTCVALLVPRLISVGLLKSRNEISIPMATNVVAKNCRRFRFANPPSVHSPPTQLPVYMKQMIDEGNRYANGPQHGQTPFGATIAQSRRSQQTQPASSHPVVNVAPPQTYSSAQTFTYYPQQNTQYQYYIPQSYAPPQQYPKQIQPANMARSYGSKTVAASVVDSERIKRQIKSSEILGQRFNIACINRGEVESEETDLLNLCSVCWTWRQLPEDYFPRLVNELICVNGKGNTCLSGWGSCHQRFRNVDVLKRVGGKWETTTISIANCCDCKVKAGTEAHALVVG